MIYLSQLVVSLQVGGKFWVRAGQGRAGQGGCDTVCKLKVRKQQFAVEV